MIKQLIRVIYMSMFNGCMYLLAIAYWALINIYVCIHKYTHKD
jgi:hypothetical protein